MIRLYRALLRLYPAAFRSEYGEEMSAIFVERARGVGLSGRAWMLLAAVPEVTVNAAAAHWDLLRQDLSYTLRSLRRAPAFATTAVLVTALGVGANTAAFTMADFVLLQPLPFPDPESLVRVCSGPAGRGGWGCNNQISPSQYRDYAERTSSFERMGAFERTAANLVGGGEPQRLALARLTDEVFPLLGVPAALGRVFGEGGAAPDDERVAVLGHGLWQSRFGGDPRVLGRTIDLDGTSHVVVGVMPASFRFPDREAQLWTPLRLTEDDYADRFNNYLEGVARLAEGFTFDQAAADLASAHQELAVEQPDLYADAGISFFRMRDTFSPRFRLMLQALCGASLCILVLACANLANLLLARAGAREGELAVRAALGAGRERLARQLLTESVVLALAGGGAGLLVAIAMVPLLSLMVPETLPIASAPALDLRLVSVAVGFTALTGLGFGLFPALQAGRHPALDALRTGLRGDVGGRRAHRAVLVSIEVAASVVLLVTSGLLIRAVSRVETVDPGFRSDQVLAVRTVLPKPKYDSLATRDVFYREVLTRVRALPGVQAAGYTSGLPMVMMGGIAQVVVPGREAEPGAGDLVSRRYVSPQFFEAMGIPLLAGRDFEEADTGDRGWVAIVSESFARRYWPDDGAVGKELVYQDRARTVVGVVGDIRVRGLERTSEPQMYLTASQVPVGAISAYDLKDMVVRTSGPPTALLSGVRAIIHDVDPDQPISDVMTLDDLLANQTASRRAQLRVLVTLAVVALLLAGVGIHGLLAYTVAQRRREIGVRLALGAEPGAIVRRVAWDGVRLVLIGLLPGVAIAYVAGRSMSALLFGVRPADPATMAAAVGLCLGTALVGALMPALRAVRTSAVAVMRAE